ncbi:SDR family oxidoreductase [Chachezhania sediminis]|uniref:SDR family oxidoreductase n=1 Tax=Chachezhania sediminis TaxID=2599291 RepID=UPI00131AA3B2|nr:SDR family oxidoreductase [Chachezhania sediminis]
MSRKTLLITGASTGIGAATARLAAARGYDLALNYATSRDAAEAVAKECEAAGAACLLCPGDVATPEGIAAIYGALDKGFGRIDALANNAGVVAPIAKVTDYTHDRLRQIFDINVIGAMLVAKEAVLRMQAQGTGGAIVNTSSVAARLGSPNEFVDYAATKAAVDTFTQGLAREVADQGIRVNAVRPGLIASPIHGKSGAPDRAERLKGGIPMGRVGSVEEVATAILYLLSDEASYITGTTLDISGGR